MYFPFDAQSILHEVISFRNGQDDAGAGRGEGGECGLLLGAALGRAEQVSGGERALPQGSVPPGSHACTRYHLF